MLKMKIKKGESHRALFIPVLLVIAATFLATSLGSFSGNDITGAQYVGGPVKDYDPFKKFGCEWILRPDSSYGGSGPGPSVVTVRSLCPGNKNIVSGGCSRDNPAATTGEITPWHLRSSEPFFLKIPPPFGLTGDQGWLCEYELPAGYSGGTFTPSATAYCCSY